MAVFQRSYLMPALFSILLFCLSFWLVSIDLDIRKLIQGLDTVDFDGNLDLFSLEQDDPRLVEYVKHNFLIKTGTKGGKNLRLANNPPILAAQFNQSLEVDKIYNSSLFNGFFIEAGAFDGESLSNSLFFELERGWTGLLVEANSELVKRIEDKNRNAWISPTCLSIEMKPIFAEFEQAGVNGAINNEQELGQGGSNMEQVQ
ncbi:uncharacterized protein LOC111714158 [Eurytemora carolleeae]|uniref:uncharacterized protein LOC111714158 n=1 Tax=Eurytemora carolleeae TaxID=1294199 RepID=UPI000C755CED|nr:uncharacterized protein LOC111714158 [Eurytemora carolleeae]|eukprot:XP_023344973.1 uncharacterized protein LOC111714158 [Eurytemora affinis]